MLLSWKWLNELISLPVSIQEVAEGLTVTGSEIEAIHRPCEKVKGLRVAQVISAEQHPTKSGLTVTQLDLGEGEPQLCVTAAKNVKVGDKIPYCLPGSSVASGMTLGYRDFDGFNSAGMMASAAELGVPELSSVHGILILPADAPLGADVVQWLGLDDAVLEMSITPNRGDMLSLYGVARELYALFPGSELHLPEIKAPSYDGDWTLPFEGIRLESEGCSAYRLGMADQVRIAPAPMQMQVRLCLSGMRPINNVVDATNLAMLTLGQPLHAFDAASLPGRDIGVRAAREGEHLISLDGKDRLLLPSDMVISSGGVAVGLAGVMGGENSEITERTQHILVESANFSAPLISKTSRRLGIPSEASFRYARGVDPLLTADALNYVLFLMEQWGAARCFAKNYYAQPKAIEPKKVPLTRRKLQVYLSWSDMDESERILGRLGIQKAEDHGESALYVAPTRRPDIAIEEDLIEEIGRIRGYNDIEPTIPQLHKAGTVGPLMETHRLLRHCAISRGYTEVVTYSFIRPELLEILRYPTIEGCKVLSNPIGAETTLRPLLLPSLLAAVSKAVSQGWREAIRLFECGKAFVPDGGAIVEKTRCAGVLFTGADRRCLYDRAKEDFLSVKADVEALTMARNVTLSFRQGSLPWGHSGQTAEIWAMGQPVGYLARVKPAVALEMDLQEPLFAFEIDLDPLIQGQNLEFSKGFVYPPVYRDISMVVPLEVSCQKVQEDLRAAAGPALAQIRLFDVYRGAGIPQDCRSMAFSMAYRQDRTLTDQEVDAQHNALREALEKQGYRLR